MKLATDAEILEMFNKYRVEVIKKLVEEAKDDGFEVTEEVKESELWDEIFCGMLNDDFIGEVTDGIVDSVGFEEYGFKDVNEE